MFAITGVERSVVRGLGVFWSNEVIWGEITVHLCLFSCSARRLVSRDRTFGLLTPFGPPRDVGPTLRFAEFELVAVFEADRTSK